jgi:hypothetical protein
MKHLLYAHSVPINDAITVVIPSVGEVLDAEDDYFSAVTSIISTPYDMMVQLDDAGIDFTKISTFELFCMLFTGLQNMDTSLVFGDLDLTKFEPAINNSTKELVLLDSENNIVIDRAIHEDISNTIKRILQIKKPVKKPGNEEGRKYMIRIARMNMRKQARLMRNKDTSQLEDIIISLVNNREFPYNYETVRDITIHQLYQSLNQVAHKTNYDNTMHGYYGGTIKLEDLKIEDRTWIKS